MSAVARAAARAFRPVVTPGPVRNVARVVVASWLGGAAVAVAAMWDTSGPLPVVAGVVAGVVGAIGTAAACARVTGRHEANARARLDDFEGTADPLEGELRRAATRAEIAARGRNDAEERVAALQATVDGLEAALSEARRMSAREARARSAAPVGAIGIDDVGRVEWVNPEAARILGIGGEDPAPTGRTLFDVAGDAGVAAVMADAWTGGSPVTREVRLAPWVLPDPPSRTGASPRSVRVMAIPYVDDGSAVATDACPGTPGVIFLLDETEMRRAEEIRRDFVANVSHELRTPLTSLMALVETLEEGAIDDPDARREFLRLMHDEVDGLTHLVLSVLDLSLIESGQAPLNLAPVGALPILTSAQRRLRTSASRQGVDLRIAMEDDLPPLLADPVRIGEVLLNLISNSIKFTPRAGSITVTASRDEACVRFAVADTGVGVSPDELPRLFERFYKTDRSRASVGSGLGLAIAKHLVQVHGGEIGVESDGEGLGTTVWFTIPVVPPAPSTPEDAPIEGGEVPDDDPEVPAEAESSDGQGQAEASIMPESPPRARRQRRAVR